MALYVTKNLKSKSLFCSEKYYVYSFHDILRRIKKGFDQTF